MSNLIYLDTNIFDRIEKELHNEKYSLIKEHILDKTFICLYSNAHINDLYRGFIKNSMYTEGHLNNIKILTNNLCLCQYWGNSEVTVHYRDIFEFFNETVEENEAEPKSFDDLVRSIDESFYHLIEVFKEIPFSLPDNVELPNVMSYLKVNNVYDLINNIYNFYTLLKTDYSLYKSYKRYLRETIAQCEPEIKKLFSDNSPKHLDISKIADKVELKNKTSENKKYSDVIETFFKFDLDPHHTDKFFNNMFEDALHVFYASHCDFFITNDKNCKFKAEKTYKKLNIKTIVITSEEVPSII